VTSFSEAFSQIKEEIDQIVDEIVQKSDANLVLRQKKSKAKQNAWNQVIH